MLDLSFGPFLYGGLSLFAGALVGYWLLRNAKPKSFAMLVIGHVLAALWLYLSAHAGAGTPAHSGMAAALKLLVLVLLVAPSLLGFLLGGGIGWWRGPRPKAD
jgi:hypothetical protein